VGNVLLRQLREQVVEAGIKLVQGRLVYLSAGNVSARDPDTGLIAAKPGGGDYLTLKPEDIMIIDKWGNIVEGEGQPSSETPMHTAAYRRRPEVNGAVHTHSPAATAWSVAGRAIPPVTVGQVLTDGPIPIAPYHRPGSEAIAQAAMEAMGDGYAVILQNHGPFVVGATLDMALATAFIVEEAAEVAFRAVLLADQLRLMTRTDFDEMLGGDSRG
jgi:L-ribulose-5-phosphate 4-epimerase